MQHTPHPSFRQQETNVQKVKNYFGKQPRSSVTSGGAPAPITVVPPDLGDGSDEGDDLRPLSRHELRLTLAR